MLYIIGIIVAVIAWLLYILREDFRNLKEVQVGISAALYPVYSAEQIAQANGQLARAAHAAETAQRKFQELKGVSKEEVTDELIHAVEQSLDRNDDYRDQMQRLHFMMDINRKVAAASITMGQAREEIEGNAKRAFERIHERIKEHEGVIAPLKAKLKKQ